MQQPRFTYSRRMRATNTSRLPLIATAIVALSSVVAMSVVGDSNATAASKKVAKKTVAKIKTFIAEKKILTLPDPDRCQIIEMPEFQRGFSAAYLDRKSVV